MGFTLRDQANSPRCRCLHKADQPPSQGPLEREEEREDPGNEGEGG